MKAVINATSTLMPPTPQALWGERALIMDLLKVGTKKVQPNQAPILGGLKQDNPLAGLPVLTSWQEDGGPFVTLPLVYTEHPDEVIITSACIACRFMMTSLPGCKTPANT